MVIPMSDELDHVYVSTVKVRRHDRDYQKIDIDGVHRTLLGAIDALAEIEGHDVSVDLDQWNRRQGNQHRPTRYRHWEKYDDGRIVTYYIRQLPVED